MAESLPIDDGWHVSFEWLDPESSIHQAIRSSNSYINWDRRVAKVSSLRPGHHCRLLQCWNCGTLNLVQVIKWDDGTLWAVKSPISSDEEDDGNSVNSRRSADMEFDSCVENEKDGQLQSIGGILEPFMSTMTGKSLRRPMSQDGDESKSDISGSNTTYTSRSSSDTSTILPQYSIDSINRSILGTPNCVIDVEKGTSQTSPACTGNSGEMTVRLNQEETRITANASARLSEAICKPDRPAGSHALKDEFTNTVFLRYVVSPTFISAVLIKASRAGIPVPEIYALLEDEHGIYLVMSYESGKTAECLLDEIKDETERQEARKRLLESIAKVVTQTLRIQSRTSGSPSIDQSGMIVLQADYYGIEPVESQSEYYLRRCSHIGGALGHTIGTVDHLRYLGEKGEDGPFFCMIGDLSFRNIIVKDKEFTEICFIDNSSVDFQPGIFAASGLPMTDMDVVPPNAMSKYPAERHYQQSCYDNRRCWVSTLIAELVNANNHELSSQVRYVAESTFINVIHILNLSAAEVGDPDLCEEWVAYIESTLDYSESQGTYSQGDGLSPRREPTSFYLSRNRPDWSNWNILECVRANLLCVQQRSTIADNCDGTTSLDLSPYNSSSLTSPSLLAAIRGRLHFLFIRYAELFDRLG